MNTLVKKVDKPAWYSSRSGSPKLQAPEKPITDLVTPLTDIGEVIPIIFGTG